METAADMGADEICILSATGSRLDHSVGNILILSSLLERNIKGWIEDDNNRVYLTGGRMELERLDNWKVSLISLSPEVRGLTTEGLFYPLKDYTLKRGSSLGISNEFVSETAVVSFDKGLLMVILSRDDKDAPGEKLTVQESERNTNPEWLSGLFAVLSASSPFIHRYHRYPHPAPHA